jgi:hypothetical protein
VTGRVFSQRPLYQLVITTAVLNGNVRTLLSSPSVAGDVVVTISSTGSFYSNGSTVAMRWGTGWPAGCTFKLVNQGIASGHAGDGGAGGTGVAGSAGTAGTDAMDLDGNAVSIDNGSGSIFGGGGGGGGGGAGSGGTGGGGGGGGQSYGTAGGAGAGGGGAHPGSAGSAGSSSGPGGGGAGGTGGITDGGAGGRGGYWGEAGFDGSTSAALVAGGAGGGPGRAIFLNGGSVSWLSGNDSTHVKGAVS